IGLAVVVDSPYINKNTVCCAMLQLSDFKLTATQLHHTLAAAQLDTRFACLCQQSFPSVEIHIGWSGCTKIVEVLDLPERDQLNGGIGPVMGKMGLASIFGRQLLGNDFRISGAVCAALEVQCGYWIRSSSAE